MSGVEPDSVERFVDVLGATRRQLRRTVGRPFPEPGLSAAQAELVRHVRRNPGCSVASAAATLGIAPNTVSTLVRQLADAGLLRRAPDPSDRRAARLTLTPAARQRLTRWRSRRLVAVREAWDALPAADRRALTAAVPAMQALAAALSEGGQE